MPRCPVRRLSNVVAFAIVLAIAGLGPLFAADPVAAWSNTRVVRSGQSIQAALDASRPGARIIVKSGTYAEQLTVTKSGITLIGWGAVLVPPPHPVTNSCSGLAGPGTQAGICVTGRDVQLAPFVEEHSKFLAVGHRVRDVTVTGFEVRGFSGANVAIVGATGARVESNRLIDGDNYGALSVGSKYNRFSSNEVRAPAALRFIGICVDDVGPVTVSRNDVSGNIIGLCIQTPGADVYSNRVHDNCVGVFVDPGIAAFVHRNEIANNNGPCAEFFLTGIGIFLQGTVNTQVRDNRISGHTPGDFGAGLVLIDDDPPGPPTSNTVVKYNVFRDNTRDLQVASTGAGNVVARNLCTTSDPPELCD